MASNEYKLSEFSNNDTNVFWSQYKILLWKLIVTAKRSYQKTLFSALSPLAVIICFRWTFYNPLEPPNTCYTMVVIPPFITLDIFTSFGYLLHISMIVSRLAGEQYHQQQTLLFVMGCKRSAYYLANITFDLVHTSLLALYMAIGLRYIILICSSLSLVVITYLLHGIQSVAFSYFLCMFSCKRGDSPTQPSTLITLSILIWFISKTIRVAAEFELGVPSDSWVHLVSFINCMLPQTALFQINPAIVGDADLSLANVFRLTSRRSLPVGYIWLSMIFSSIFFIMGSWYSILGSGVGSNVYDCALRQCTIKLGQCIKRMFVSFYSCCSPTQPSFVPHMMGTDGATNEKGMRDLIEIFQSGCLQEPEPIGQLEPGITIRGVTKFYNKSEPPVVDNLSLTVYKGQTTILLGHNGAGKTTLMKMIIGLLDFDEGSVTISGGHSIQSQRQLARLSLGYCPQMSITFDNMTVEEHLRLFCGIKGITESDLIKATCQSVIAGVKLSSKKDNLVSELSGGMVRKLSLAIALVGRKQQVLILDEPSSGLDPESRESIWQIVQHYGQQRAILITTQHMEEADHLGDRIAIMSRGKIVCSGSGVFLKERFGNGYVVRLGLKDEMKKETRAKILTFMKQALASSSRHQQINNREEELRQKLATIVRQITLRDTGLMATCNDGDELSLSDDTLDMIIPIEALGEQDENELLAGIDYENFFKHLEKNQASLGIESFGITSSSMEDVFNNISSMANKLPANYNNNLDKKGKDPKKRISTKKDLDFSMEHYRYRDSSKDKACVNWKHIKATIKRHLIILRNTWQSYLAMRFFYFVLVYMLVVVLTRVRVRPHPILRKKIVTYTIYTCVPFILPFMVSHYVQLSNRDKKQDGSKFIQHMMGLHPAIYWSVQYFYDSFSMILNGLILVVTIWFFDFTEPFFDIDFTSSINIWLSFAILAMLFSSGSALLSYSISGYFSTPAGAVMAMSIYHTMAFFLSCGAILFQQQGHRTYNNYLRVTTVLNPGFAITDAFRKLYDSATMYKGEDLSSYTGSIENEIANEIAKPFQFIIDKQNKQIEQSESDDPDDYIPADKDFQFRSKLFSYNIQNGLWINATSLILYNLLALVLLIMEENGYNMLGKWMSTTKKVFDCSSSGNTNQAVVQSATIPMQRFSISIDNSVHVEKLRAHNLIYQPNKHQDHSAALVVSELRKSFKEFVAVDGLSMVLNRSECFGLLGINGAGKTTSFSMICTKLKKDNGQMECFNFDSVEQLKLYRKQIGYDPQSSTRFYDLTCWQTLYHVALLRGMREDKIEKAIEALLTSFDMKMHTNKRMDQLSGGTQRKLSLAIAMICTPPVLILDEPTAGIDPLSRRSIWKCINECKKLHNCSIIISSHAMEECEAICDRIGLMAGGKLHSLGSFQQLRKKYSQGYVIRVQFIDQNYNLAAGQHNTNDFSSVLTIGDRKQLSSQPSRPLEKVDTKKTLDVAMRKRGLTEYLETITKNMQIDYTNVNSIVYKVNDPNISRSTLFNWMEGAKSKLQGVDFSYLISDTSLEDVFLTFAKDVDRDSH